MAVNSTSIKNSINTNFATNNAGLIVAAILRATLILLVDWIAGVVNSVPTSENVSVENLTSEALVTHNLNSVKLSVEFYKNDRLVTNIDWEAVSPSQIRIYLPYSDTPVVDTFTGDIFLLKRA